MKNINNALLYLLIGCILILSACAKSPVTPTDVTQTEVSSEVSVENPSVLEEPSPVVSSVTKTEPSADKKPQSSGKKEPSKPKETAVKYGLWDSDSDRHYWDVDHRSFKIKYPSFLGYVILCNSKQDLEAYLQRRSHPLSYADGYDDGYFQNNSLLLFEGHGSSGQATWEIASLTAKESSLTLSLRYILPNIHTTDGFARVYRVEIGEKLEQITKIRCTTVYQVNNEGKITTDREVKTEYTVGELPEDPAIDYVAWDLEAQDHYWEDRESIRFEYPSSFLIDSVLCHTYDDFTRYLQENGYPMACAEDYPPSYFETQSLLLFEGRDADGGWLWEVESLILEDNTLQISLLHKRSKNMATQMAVYRIYQIQLKEKPTEVEKLHFTVTQQREKADGKYQTEKTFAREFSVQ